jgi:hypothetical protein
MRGRAALLIFSAFLAASSFAAETIPMTFQCGTYRFRGKLGTRNGGVHVIEVHPGTTERFEVVLHRLSAEDAIGYAGKNVELEAFVYHSGVGGEARARIVGRPHPVSHSSLKSDPVLVEEKACK